MMHYSQNSFILFIFLCLQVGQVISQGNCPNATEILPCYCQELAIDNVQIYCNDAITEEEIEQAFLADFPKTDLYTFQIQRNQELTELSKNLFLGVSFQRIMIQGTKIVSIDASFFDTCYNTVIEIILEDNAIVEFPFDVLSRFTVLTKLDMDYNFLTSLPKLTSSTITDLYFYDNSIEVLEDFIFTDCTSLETVQLSYNLIVNMPVSSFIGANTLKSISIQGNRIEVLRTGLFTSLPVLTDISLSQNQLTHIEDGTFINLPSLANLFISYTNVTSLRREIFFDVFDVGEFQMSHSLIETLEPFTFIDAHSTSLSIWLDSNRLTTIVENAFAGVVGNFIVLDGNLISTIEPGAFGDLTNSVLFLDNNKIETLDESWLKPILEAGNTVDVKFNPLECGCDLYWLLFSSNLFPQLIDSPACANGTLLRDLNIVYYLNNCGESM